jgi:hypothetical protein
MSMGILLAVAGFDVQRGQVQRAQVMPWELNCVEFPNIPRPQNVEFPKRGQIWANIYFMNEYEAIQLEFHYRFRVDYGKHFGWHEYASNAILSMDLLEQESKAWCATWEWLAENTYNAYLRNFGYTRERE